MVSTNNQAFNGYRSIADSLCCSSLDRAPGVIDHSCPRRMMHRASRRCPSISSIVRVGHALDHAPHRSSLHRHFITITITIIIPITITITIIRIGMWLCAAVYGVRERARARPLGESFGGSAR